MERRVVITGMGAVTPIGNTAREFWQNAVSGKNGIGRITRFDTDGFKAKLAAEVKDFCPEKYMSPKDAKRMELFCQFAMAAAHMAMEDSGLTADTQEPDRLGVMIGSGIGGLGIIEEQVLRLAEKGPGRVAPLFIPMAIANMAGGNVAIRYGARGACAAIVTACATACNSIGEAFRYIKHGYADVMITGGTEASVTKIGIAGFINLTALSTSEDPDRASIPFDKERSGFVMGEGAGVLILEEMEAALSRGARIYAEVAGYGANCDAFHITSPQPKGEGAAKAMALALAEAGLQPSDIGYINAHGTGTPINDAAETSAIKSVFGEHAKNLLISSTKSMTGHLLGATGAIESIAAVMAMVDGVVPPTIGFHQPDPECDLNYTINTAIKRDISASLNNSFGFGGHNAVLCFKKYS